MWRDEADPAEACAEVRDLRGHQLSVHRLIAGFDDEVEIAAKNGSLWGVLNEASVVEYPDGGRYAVAVFLRTPQLAGRNSAVDAAMARAARTASPPPPSGYGNPARSGKPGSPAMTDHSPTAISSPAGTSTASRTPISTATGESTMKRSH
ncbi:serine hydrolase [Streptomyces longisporoflavus]|uniref:Serine hydrolase n=1 Tax=Streptomyces longisporoflavus TaxID=28044 RepID=A0ABW7R3H2_9ACTN